MKRDFEQWFKTFIPSINKYGYYIDFEKVYENAQKHKVEICILNALIGSKNIEAEFDNIINKFPCCLKVIPILLAVRDMEIFCRDQNGSISYRFDQKMQTLDQYKYFMRQTGLFDMMENHIIANLYDYVTGVEVGLDSNGRKNRGGAQMAALVESFLQKSNIKYEKEFTLEKFEKLWNIDLSAISSQGTSSKRWDFAVKTNTCTYGIETNFYSSGGSKLNETARSYQLIAEEAKTISSFKFIWITDGGGWKSAKGNLNSTFNTLDDLYNINDMENGLFDHLFL